MQMPSAASMVFTNLLVIILYCFFYFFYRFVYPKKTINIEFALPFILLLPIISLLRPGDFESGDFNIHIYRIIAFHDSLREGNVMPSWAGELNNGYGYPLFIFNYSFPYYAVSLFKLIGFSFISGMKLYLGINLFLSGIFMYMFVKQHTKNVFAAFTASILYTFNPYHLIDVHFRATLGEVTIFTIAPLTFFLLSKYLQIKKPIYFVLCSLTVAIMFMSHTLMAGVFLFILLCFLILNAINMKSFTSMFAGSMSILLGVIGSIHSWAPFFLYKNYTLQDEFTQLYLYPFLQTIYSPWKFGLLYQGPSGELSLLIGYAQLIIIVLSLYFLIQNKFRLSSFYIFWIFLTVLFIFMISPPSYPIWGFLPSFLWQLTPTGRLMLFLSFTTSALGSYFYLFLRKKKFGKQIVMIILLVSIFTTILNWGHRRMITTITDETLRQNLSQSTKNGEGHFYANSIVRNPNDPWFATKPMSPIESISGDTEITIGNRSTTEHNYLVSSTNGARLKENTLYFPGWIAATNNTRIKTKPSIDGATEFEIPKGNNSIRFYYEDPPFYKIPKTISAVVLAILCITIIFIFLQPIFSKRRSPKI